MMKVGLPNPIARSQPADEIAQTQIVMVHVGKHLMSTIMIEKKTVAMIARRATQCIAMNLPYMVTSLLGESEHRPAEQKCSFPCGESRRDENPEPNAADPVELGKSVDEVHGVAPVVKLSVRERLFREADGPSSQLGIEVKAPHG
jgi:hypothetical protein